jgi:hypothetical protein
MQRNKNRPLAGDEWGGRRRATTYAQYTRPGSSSATLDSLCTLVACAWHDALLLSQRYADPDHAELVVNLDLAARLAHRVKEEAAA